jgi:regulator of nonsense transcripts 2
MTAILDRVWPDISPPLVNDLEQQFHGQAKFKKNQNIESRFKTARYIGELTKFRVAPPIVALRCMKRCCDDFTGANIDVACCLLESCGRYLHRIKHTSARLNQLLDTMTRLSKAAVSYHLSLSCSQTLCLL